MKHRLNVKLCLGESGSRLQIYTYSKAQPGKLGIFHLRLDLVWEMVLGKRQFFLDLDGCSFCRCNRFFDDLSFCLTFLKAEGDFDHLNGYLQCFQIPVAAVKQVLEDGRPRCFMFGPEEMKPKRLNVAYGGAYRLKVICSAPLKRRALSKALRHIDEPITLGAVHDADGFYLISETAEGSLTLMQDYVRGTDDNLYPRLRYIWDI